MLSNKKWKEEMGVDVVHIGGSGETGGQLDNRRIDVHPFGFSDTMRRGDWPLLRAMDSSCISPAGGHSVLESAVENEGYR